MSLINTVNNIISNDLYDKKNLTSRYIKVSNEFVMYV